jgi:hypothetical protein
MARYDSQMSRSEVTWSQTSPGEAPRFPQVKRAPKSEPSSSRRKKLIMRRSGERGRPRPRSLVVKPSSCFRATMTYFSRRVPELHLILMASPLEKGGPPDARRHALD